MREHYTDDPTSRAYWPVRLPPRELTAYVLERLEAGDSQSKASRVTGLSTNRVLAIKRLPERYDPIDDQVAIDRALAGDRSVLPGLSFYERQTVLDILTQRLADEPYDKSYNSRHSHTGRAHWLEVLTTDWGVDHALLAARLRKRLERVAA